jgi:hypothetical protein
MYLCNTEMEKIKLLPRTVYICVDFDGTQVEHEYPRIGKEIPGAYEAMRRWQERGAKLIMWTMRSGETLKQAVQHGGDNGIDWFGINFNPTQTSWTQSRKAYGHIYVDDAAAGAPLIHP